MTKKQDIQRRADAKRLARPAFRKLRARTAKGYVAKRRVESWADYILIHARHRAKKNGLDFSITASDIVVPAFCPITGLPIILGAPRNHPQAPSIDRVQNSLGYVKGNVAVISYRANRLKGEAQIDDLRALIRYMEAHK